MFQKQHYSQTQFGILDQGSVNELFLVVSDYFTLYKKWSFLLRISTVNVTKSAGYYVPKRYPSLMREWHVPVFDVLGGLVVTFRSWGNFFWKLTFLKFARVGNWPCVPLGKMIYGFMMVRKEIRDWCFYFKIVGTNH